MRPLHIVNSETEFKSLNISRVLKHLQALDESTQRTFFKLDRIVFSELSSARQFVSGLAGTSWSKDVVCTPLVPDDDNEETCTELCHKELEGEILRTSEFDLKPPKLACGIELGYELGPFLEKIASFFHSNQNGEEQKIEIEIYSGSSSEELQN